MLAVQCAVTTITVPVPVSELGMESRCIDIAIPSRIVAGGLGRHSIEWGPASDRDSFKMMPCKPLPARRRCNLLREGDTLPRSQSSMQRTASRELRHCHFGESRSRLAGGYLGFSEVIWVTSPHCMLLQCSRMDRTFQNSG